MDAKTAMRAAIALHQAGKPAEAAKIYTQVLAAQPDHADALHLLGVAHHQGGEHERAVELIGKAMALGPPNARYLSNLGEAYKALGQHAEAAESYRQALAVDPALAGVHYNLGNVLAELDMADEAIASYGRALALDADDAEVHNNLGNVLLAEERLEEAAASYRRAVDLKPDYANAHGNLGSALRDMGRLDDAAASCRRALEIDPGMAEAHCNLGIALKEMGRRQEGAACFRRALEIRPHFAEAHYMHARAHHFAPGEEGIARIAEALAAKGVTDDERSYLLFALGKAHDDIGLYDQAFAYYGQANEAMARRADYDAAAHGEMIDAIEKVFSQAPEPVTGATDGDADGAAKVPVFVIGMSRTGKTLVESLLTRHDAVHGAGESLELEGALRRVVDENSIPWIYPQCVRFLSAEQINEVGMSYMERISRDAPRARLLVNTLPANYQYLGLILQALPAARIIFCQRHPFDTCLYVYFSRYRHGNRHSYELPALGAYYADFHRLMAHWTGLFGERILRVRYEALVEDPGQVAARAYRFCGLADDAAAPLAEFTDSEVGHWRHYESHLDDLRRGFAAPIG
jgi:tetratricopeptide (TPR) repeat protein